jgi:predicted transcriptional regulator
MRSIAERFKNQTSDATSATIEKMQDPRSTFAELPFLSSSEWRIFYLLSKKGPLSIKALVAELEDQRPGAPLAYTTILTHAQRLVGKGYLTQHPIGGSSTANVYALRVAFDATFSRHVERFLSDFTFDNPDELESIRQMIDQRLGRVSR